MILPNQTLVDLMKREPRGDVLARHLPMVVEPEPWSKFDKGGFIESPSPLVRIKHGEKDQVIYAKAAIARGDMKTGFRSHEQTTRKSGPPTDVEVVWAAPEMSTKHLCLRMEDADVSQGGAQRVCRRGNSDAASESDNDELCFTTPSLRTTTLTTIRKQTASLTSIYRTQ